MSKWNIDSQRSIVVKRKEERRTVSAADYSSWRTAMKFWSANLQSDICWSLLTIGVGCECASRNFSPCTSGKVWGGLNASGNGCGGMRADEAEAREQTQWAPCICAWNRLIETRASKRRETERERAGDIPGLVAGGVVAGIVAAASDYIIGNSITVDVDTVLREETFHLRQTRKPECIVHTNTDLMWKGNPRRSSTAKVHTRQPGRATQDRLWARVRREKRQHTRSNCSHIQGVRGLLTCCGGKDPGMIAAVFTEEPTLARRCSYWNICKVSPSSTSWFIQFLYRSLCPFTLLSIQIRIIMCRSSRFIFPNFLVDFSGSLQKKICSTKCIQNLFHCNLFPF